jgi:ABC-type transport system involved in multi-copper enzyme maturation permease subunit
MKPFEPIVMIGIILALLAMVVGGMYCLRRFEVFGPVFWYDLIRTSRRGFTAVARVLYGGVLLAALLMLFMSWTRFSLAQPADWFKPLPIRHEQMPQFATSIVSTFITLQFLAVVLVVPLLTAGTIVQAKQRGTLEFLFTTDLSNGEIVFGLLGSRLAHLLLLLLTALPVSSLILFLGGVDPNVVIVAFGITLVTALTIGSLSMLVSIHGRTELGATFATYLFTAGLAISLLVCLPCMVPLFDSLSRVAAGVTIGVGIELTTTCVCLLYAVRTLRKDALLPAPSEEDRVDPLEGLYNRTPPKLSERPMLWKESFISGMPVRNNPFFVFMMISIYLGWYGLLLCWYLAWFLSALLPSVVRFEPHQQPLRDLDPLFQTMGIGLSSLLMWLIAIDTAGRVTRERERQTLDSLFTTDLSRREILYDKWYASIRSFRFLLYGLPPLVVLAFLSGGLPFERMCLWALAVAAYVYFAGHLGLYFSVRCRSTLRATVLTGGALFGLFFVPLFADVTRVASPPCALHALWSTASVTANFPSEALVAAVLAIAGYTVVSGLLAWRSIRRFEREGHA